MSSAIGQELRVEVGGLRHVGEAGVGVALARSVAGEVLERGQDALGVHALDEGPRVGDDLMGVG